MTANNELAFDIIHNWTVSMISPTKPMIGREYCIVVCVPARNKRGWSTRKEAFSQTAHVLEYSLVKQGRFASSTPFLVPVFTFSENTKIESIICSTH